MLNPTSTTKIIASGAWAKVRIKDMSSGAMKVIGLCTDASYTESFGLVDHSVINHVGPVSIDSQNYQCTIQIGSFVPENPSSGDKYSDGGEATFSDIMPARADVIDTGQGRTFYYMDFYNSVTGSVICAFAHAVVADGGCKLGATSFITHNISLRAMERTKPAAEQPATTIAPRASAGA